MYGRQDQVLTILVFPGIAGECEQPSRRETQGIALRLHPLVLGLEFLKAHPGIGFPLRGLHVLPGVVVHLGISMVVRVCHRGKHFEAGTGFFEVKVVQRVRPGLHIAGNGPLADVPLTDGVVAGGVVGNLLQTR